MSKYNDYVQRGRKQHAEKFSEAGLARNFIGAFDSGERVTVAFCDGEGKVIGVERGTVGVTTGWIPTFLLMRRSSDIGSSYTLSTKDRITTIEEWREFKRKERE